MEVGEKGAYDLELVAGIDKEIGMAVSGADSAGALSGCVFESADSGSANSNHAARFPTRPIDLFSGGFGDGIGLGMKPVFLHRFCTNGLESSEPDVERDLGGLDPTFANAR